MVRTGGILLGFLAAGLALLHGIITLNPGSIFESGLLAMNAVAFAPEAPDPKP